jgi:hypothetical protein
VPRLSGRVDVVLRTGGVPITLRSAFVRRTGGERANRIASEALRSTLQYQLESLAVGSKLRPTPQLWGKTYQDDVEFN